MSSYSSDPARTDGPDPASLRYARRIDITCLRVRWVGAAFVTLACGGTAFEGFNDDPGDAGASGKSTSGGSPEGGRSGAPSAGGTTAAGASTAGRASGGRAGQGGTTTSAGSTNEGGAMNGGGTGGTSTNPGAGRAGSGHGGSGGAGNGGTGTSGDAGRAGGGEAGVGGVVVGGAAGSGGTGPDPRCPDEMPKNNVACQGDDLVCSYDTRGCLCTLASRLLCTPVDPQCAALPMDFVAPPAGGSSGKVAPVPTYTTCKCTSSGMGSGSWECSVTG